MKSFKDKLLDILLYPRKLYESLTDKRGTLYAGIVAVGIIDLLLPDVAKVLDRFFSGKSLSDVYINAVLLVFVTITLGIVDVIFVCVPLHDFFKFLKKKEASIYIRGREQETGQPYMLDEKESYGYSSSRIKIMKVYIMSHFIIIPVSTIVYYAFLRNITEEIPVWAQNLSLTYFMLILIWAAAIVTRGINTQFRFNPIIAKLTFIIVFTWNFIFGMVFDMQIMNWLLKLFR